MIPSVAEAGRRLRAGETAAEELRAGIPFLVKDVMDMTGLATTCGSAVPARAASRDAACVARLAAAGAVPLGKAATYEFAMTGPAFDLPEPPAVNPHDASRITGGSSSGPAVAVAAGLCRVALGTATSGSVRDPAAHAAVEGLARAGAEVAEVEWPDYALLVAAGAVVLHAEALEAHRGRLREHGTLYGAGLRRRLAASAVLGPAHLAAARALMPRLRREMDAAMAGCEAVVTAGLLAPAPTVEACLSGGAAAAARHVPFNVTGHPALAVPCGRVRGLPVALQAVGPWGAEGALFRVGEAVEAQGR